MMNTQNEQGNDHSADVSSHYCGLAERYDYLYKEKNEGTVPFLMKALDLKPEHVVADVGSGTGFMAEKVFELSGLSNPIWCIDPSEEMQEACRQRNGLYPVQKTAEELFSDPHISESFDRVLIASTAHHFVNHAAVYKGIFRSLRPGGRLVQLCTLKAGHPIIKSAAKLTSESFERGKEMQCFFLPEIDSDAKVSHEEVSFSLGLTKSKLYDLFRGRYMSPFKDLSDDEIKEGIRELDNELLKDVKNEDVINHDHVRLFITTVEKVA